MAPSRPSVAVTPETPLRAERASIQARFDGEAGVARFRARRLAAGIRSPTRIRSTFDVTRVRR